MEKPYDIRERARLFADDAFAFCYRLRAKRRDCGSMADQLADASGSIGANLAEAKDAESKKDFIHKNSLALKEANETKYWLQRAWTAEKSLRSQAEPLIQEASELIKILGAIIVTAKSNNDRGCADDPPPE
jgi:four helix bundle protein